MSRLMRRAERVKEVIPISKVLVHYGYPVDDRDPEREQKFPCDMHGDGVDEGASAKMYAQSSSNAFYCWGCGRVRDSIALVRDKQNLSFAEAITFLEKMFSLPNLPWEEEDSHAGTTPADKPPSTEKLLGGLLTPKEPVHDILKRVDSFLGGIYLEHSLPVERCAAYWETHDKLRYMEDKKLVPEDSIKKACVVLLDKLKEELQIGPHRTT